MAKKQEKKAKSYEEFDLDQSQMVEENERILKQGPQTMESAPQPILPQPAAPQSEMEEQSEAEEPQPEHPVQTAQEEASESTTEHRHFTLTPLKSEKGVKVMLPMDYYFKMVHIKECTGMTLQELSALAVREFVDRFFNNK